jgi:hypothetical protein
MGAVFPGRGGRVKAVPERGRVSDAVGPLRPVGDTRMIERPGVGRYDPGT